MLPPCLGWAIRKPIGTVRVEGDPVGLVAANVIVISNNILLG